MWFLLSQISLLLLVAAALGAAISYWWFRSRYEDVTDAHEDLLAYARRLEKQQADLATRDDLGSHMAGVTAAIASDLHELQERLQGAEQAIGGIRMPEVDLSPVRGRLEAIEAQLKAPDPAIDQIRNNLGELQSAVRAVSSSVAGLGTEGFQPIAARLAHIDQQVQDTRADIDLGPVHSALITLQLSLDELKTAPRAEPLLQGLADVQKAVAGITLPEPDLRPIEAALADLGNILDGLERRVVKLDRPVVDLQPTLQQVQHTVAGLQEAVQGMPPPDLSPVVDTVLSIDSRQDLAALENRLTAIEYSLAALHHMQRSRPEQDARIDMLRRPRPAPRGNGDPRTPGAQEQDPIDSMRRSGDRANLLIQPAFGPPDNLELIAGIGPYLAGLLHSIGVYYFWQIAEWSDEDVAWVDSQLRQFRGRIQHDGWVGHARHLAGLPASAKRPGTAPGF